MSWKTFIYKVGQVFGIAAVFFVAFVLIAEPFHETRLWIRAFEILGSLTAGAFQLYQLYYDWND